MSQKSLIVVLAALAVSVQTLQAYVVDSADPSVQSSVGNDSALLSIEGRAKSILNEAAIDAKYKAGDLPAMAHSIREIYQRGTSKSFARMVKLQLYLYAKYTERGDHNDLYVFNLAYYFHQIQTDSLYRQLPANVRNTVQQYIDMLPPSLNYLFFKPSFCLMNRAYFEYIYTTTAINIDSERRYVFVWNQPNQVGSNGRWVSDVTEVSGKNQLTLKVALKSKQVNMYLYTERNLSNLKNLIAAWRPGSQPSHSKWSVQLYQNQLIFSQNGRVMCASDSLYNQNRRYVYGYKGDNNYNDMTRACQWYAKECP